MSFGARRRVSCRAPIRADRFFSRGSLDARSTFTSRRPGGFFQCASVGFCRPAKFRSEDPRIGGVLAPSPRGRLPAKPLYQTRNEAVGIGLVVENVGRDAHAAKTRGDVDAFGRQTLDEAGRHPILKAKALEAEALEAKAQDMRCAKATFRRA